MNLAPLKSFVPKPWRAPLRALYTRIRHAGLNFRCNICGAGIRRFLPHGKPVELDFLCPICRSKPPHRLASIYFDTHQEVFAAGTVLVHVAPEAGLGRRLAGMARRLNMEYRAGDITGTGDHYMDILNLPFPDASIKLLYCCHVLNGMQDDRSAMREVFRVLHPDGLAILQVPSFCSAADSIETNSPEERMAVFGDYGVFRNYTNADYEARLRSAGFDVAAFRSGNVPPDHVHRYQLHGEVLHLCRKPRRAAA